MNQMLRLSCLFVGCLLPACSLVVAVPPTTTPTAEPPTPTPEIFIPVPEEARAEIAAREALAQHLGLEMAQVTLRTIAETAWPDTCLGLALTGQVCQTTVTPGFRIVLDAAQASYEVRTDRTAQTVLIAGPVEPASGGQPGAHRGLDERCSSQRQRGE